MESYPPFYLREAKPEDADELWQLMLQLAEFEGYRQHFVVTPADLLTLGLASEAPLFRAYLACDVECILAYAVVTEQRFTFDLKANWHLKEFYVRQEARGRGLGSALFEDLKQRARQHGVGRLKWDVLPTNQAAMQFYRQHQGRPEQAWQAWVLQFDNFSNIQSK